MKEAMNDGAGARPDAAQSLPVSAAEPGFVVGVGASAGGIAALREFFGHVPPQSGAAYVVILHLSPDHESRLAGVLQSTTSMPVMRVTESVRLAPDSVYVISPNTSLRLVDSMLNVSELLRFEERRAPIDIFFRTLAENFRTRAVSVVLSGTGADGSSGLRQIKEYGGLTLAQDPSDSEYQDMPRNAIASGFVDYVLPASEMPRRILAFEHRRGGPSLPPAPVGEGVADVLREILTLVRVRTGQDFSRYKVATVLRRIERRQVLHELPDIAAYARFLREHQDEAPALINELLISVTHFFRDSEAFEALERTIVPRLFLNKRAHDQVRVWVAGCATGEEAYSVAMLLKEAGDRADDRPTIQVFATDPHASALVTARDGYYTDVEVADVAAERLRRFFNRESTGYRVRRELRECVLFAQHNVLTDPPFSHLELIACRNVLIYLDRAAQQRILETFHFSLRPGAYLFLGAAETPDAAADLFSTCDKAAHIYESRTVVRRAVAAPVALPPAAPRPTPLPPEAPRPPALNVLAGDLHLQLLEELNPPSLVVARDHQVVHLSPQAGRYLQMSGGELSRDVLKLVRPELRSELRTALFQASHQNRSVSVRGMRVNIDGADRDVALTVRPVLRDRESDRNLYLVLFEERTDAERATPDRRPSVELTSPLAPESARPLEEELNRVKGELRATIEQYEIQVEEARASNEELQAVNEELRSAAEELETSKEELQSVNEELTTVNQELKVKIDELGVTNNDFQNLINATHVGTIFLDRTLRVKFATPRASDVFNLLPMDVGRSLFDITNRLTDERLQQDVQRVLHDLETVEREVQTTEGRSYLMRVLPYRTRDERIDGVVITLQEVSERKRAESLAEESEERLRSLVESVSDYAILAMTAEGVISSWNTGARRIFGYSDQDIIGQPFDWLFTPEDRERHQPARELERARAEGRAEDERWHIRKDGTRFYSSGSTTALAGGKAFIKIARDLTAAHEAAVALARAHSELDERVRLRTRDLEVEVQAHADAEERASALVARLVNVQEEERRRIARDLHDYIGQQLTALRLSLERHEQCCSHREPDDDLARARDIVREIDAQVDVLAWQMRPAALDDLGLVAALSRYLEAWSVHHECAAEFRSTGLEHDRLSPEVETTLYRVAQEALNNVAKHASASRVDVILEHRHGAVLLVIEDNGVGFNPPEDPSGASGLGLPGMRERAFLIGAALQIESEPGAGTTVILRIPAAVQVARES
jgi:two-component system CheB/CheR fusion protein